MGYYRSDSGASFKPGAQVKPPVTNPTLQVRPEAGRTPNFRTGTTATQQTVVPPKKGMFGGRMAGILKPRPGTAINGKNILSALVMNLADPVIRNLPDNPYSRTYIAQQDALAAGKPMPKGLFTDQIHAVTQHVFELVTRGDGKLPVKPIKKPTQEELESAWHHPDLKGPKGNEVGSDADPVTPGLQGPGAPGAITGNPYEPGTQDHGMYIWAKTHGKLAEDVLDKVENRGLKQAGYSAIREALGRTPTTPPASAYEGGTGITGGEFEAPELKSDVKFDPAYKVDYNQDPQGFLKDKVSLLTTSASSLQQPNFDGTSQPIGGDTPESSQPEQDFNNANTNPAEVEGYVGHPLNKKPSPEAEAANAEYGAMKFQFDPGKNMMIRIK